MLFHWILVDSTGFHWWIPLDSGYISFSSCKATAEKRKVGMCLMYIKHAEKATR